MAQLDSVLAVAVLGQFAHTMLCSQSKGAVIAVFRHSFYIQFGNDVVCMGPAELGKGPLNVLATVPNDLEWPALGLVPKQNASRSASILRVGEHLRFDFGGADVWQPPAAPVFSSNNLRNGLRLLVGSVRRRAPGGLGAVLATLDEPSLLPDAKGDPLLQAVLWPVTEIWHWLVRALAGSVEPPPSVESLVALGPGLTPSGDDFLCGMMASLNYFGRGDIATRLAASVLPIAARETSLISAAYLRCASKGHASAVLFDALQSVLSGGRDLEARLDAIHAVGHTSGWDSLAGAATACAALTTAGDDGKRRQLS